MFEEIKKISSTFSENILSVERKKILYPLITYIQTKLQDREPIRINFICTHNSRRSHLSQVWSQAWAWYFGVYHATMYSGGTEATALFPKVAETFRDQGFKVMQLSNEKNPIYGIKYASDAPPVIGFSKSYDHPFNPSTQFAAVMTCDQAFEACPVVTGCDVRIPITYHDPREYDNTSEMDEKYRERSLEIASELWYVWKMATLK